MTETGEVWDKATIEWERLPEIARQGLELESYRQGFIHGWVTGREGFDLAEEPYVTKTGKVLSDSDIEALADEAERGYDVE